jgi:hypothetical protein
VLETSFKTVRAVFKRHTTNKGTNDKEGHSSHSLSLSPLLEFITRGWESNIDDIAELALRVV